MTEKSAEVIRHLPDAETEETEGNVYMIRTVKDDGNDTKENVKGKEGEFACIFHTSESLILLVKDLLLGLLRLNLYVGHQHLPRPVKINKIFLMCHHPERNNSEYLTIRMA